MQLFSARYGAVTLISIMPAMLLLGSTAWAYEGVCENAGLSGKGLGLCTAYCEAMDCDSDSPNANGTACNQVKSKFLETTGLAEMPCAAGTGEPPSSGTVCPCDFTADTWRALMTDGVYPYQGCQLSIGPDGKSESMLFGVFEQPPDSGVFSNQVILIATIQDEDDELVKGTAACQATKYDADQNLQILSPRPFGAVELVHTFENERLEIQVEVYEACKKEIQILISDLFPELECVDPGNITDFDGDGFLAESEGGDDCDDFDSNAYPGSTYWSWEQAVSGGYDFNCDGQETKLHTTLCSSSLEDYCWYGSDATIPECGVTANALVGAGGPCGPNDPGFCLLETVAQECN